MFDLPSDLDITRVVVTKEAVDGTEKPCVIRSQHVERRSA
jgi:ATP-dependent Clp protease ATP-binding subunit ClpX